MAEYPVRTSKRPAAPARSTGAGLLPDLLRQLGSVATRPGPVESRLSTVGDLQALGSARSAESTALGEYRKSLGETTEPFVPETFRPDRRIAQGALLAGIVAGLVGGRRGVQGVAQGFGSYLEGEKAQHDEGVRAKAIAHQAKGDSVKRKVAQAALDYEVAGKERGYREGIERDNREHRQLMEREEMRSSSKGPGWLYEQYLSMGFPPEEAQRLASADRTKLLADRGLTEAKTQTETQMLPGKLEKQEAEIDLVQARVPEIQERIRTMASQRKVDAARIKEIEARAAQIAEETKYLPEKHRREGERVAIAWEAHKARLRGAYGSGNARSANHSAKGLAEAGKLRIQYLRSARIGAERKLQTAQQQMGLALGDDRGYWQGQVRTIEADIQRLLKEEQATVEDTSNAMRGLENLPNPNAPLSIGKGVYLTPEMQREAKLRGDIPRERRK